MFVLFSFFTIKVIKQIILAFYIMHFFIKPNFQSFQIFYKYKYIYLINYLDIYFAFSHINTCWDSVIDKKNRGKKNLWLPYFEIWVCIIDWKSKSLKIQYAKSQIYDILKSWRLSQNKNQGLLFFTPKQPLIHIK